MRCASAQYGHGCCWDVVAHPTSSLPPPVLNLHCRFYSQVVHSASLPMVIEPKLRTKHSCREGITTHTTVLVPARAHFTVVVQANEEAYGFCPQRRPYRRSSPKFEFVPQRKATWTSQPRSNSEGRSTSKIIGVCIPLPRLQQRQRQQHHQIE